MIRFAHGRKSASGANRPIATVGAIVRPRIRHSQNLWKRSLAATSTNPIQNREEFDNSESRESEIVPRFMKTTFQLEKIQVPINEKVTRAQEIPESYSETYAEDFVRGYVLDKMKFEKAQMIQSAFRRHMRRVTWKRRLGAVIVYNNKLKRLTLCAWRLSHLNDPDKLRALFRTFVENWNKVKDRMGARQIAPFELFYVTGQLFLPDGYTADTLYKFVYGMSAGMLHEVIQEWARVARLRRTHRTNLRFARFTMKKYSVYGCAYMFFQNWHRFVKWKRLADEKGQRKFISVQDREPNVVWKVHQDSLNAKRMRMVRATEFSWKRVGTKAARALYNRLLQKVTKNTVIEQADMFRDQRIQAKAHRGWLKFMQIKSRETQFTRDAFRSWYTMIYRLRLKRFKIGLTEKIQRESHLRRLMNQWYKVTEELKIDRVRRELVLQSSPSVMLAILFLLQNEYELFFSIMCFRGWIHYMQARKRWKAFVKWSQGREMARHETQHLVLCALKRCATLKLAQRQFVGHAPFFPRQVYVSLERAMQEMKDIRKQEMQPQWKFETSPDERCYPEKDADYNVLVRCLLLRLHALQDFDTCHFDGKRPASAPDTSRFEKLRTMDELTAQSRSNAIVFRNRLASKLRRDQAVLTGIRSHMSAIRLNQVNQQFSTQGTFLCMAVADNGQKSLGDVEIFPDVQESIDALKRQNSIAEPRLPNQFDKERGKAIEQFQVTMRDPRMFFQLAVSREVSRFLDPDATEAGGPIQNRMIEFYVHVREGSAKASALSALLSSSLGSDSAFFNIARLRQILSQFQNTEDILLSVQKVLVDACSVHIDPSKEVDLSPEGEFLSSIDPSVRRRMMKNITTFYLEFLGVKDDRGMLGNLQVPQIAKDMVGAAFSLHQSLLTTNLAQYCDEFPFLKKLSFESKLVQTTREKMWNGFKQRFVKIDLSGAAASMKPIGALAKLRQGSSAFLLSSNTHIEESLSSIDVVIAVFLLPFVLSFDSVLDFARDEVIGKLGKVHGIGKGV